MNRSYFRFVLFLPALLVLSLGTAEAQQVRFAIGPQANTLGVGGGASIHLSRTLSISGEAAFLPLDNFSMTHSDIDYALTPKVAGVVATIDLHPFKSRFAISAGMFFGGYKADAATESLSQTITIGGVAYEVEDVGAIQGSFALQGPAPLLAIGWVGRGFNLRLGAALTDTPLVRLSATGELNENATFMADLEREEADLQSSIDKLSVTPYLSLGWRLGF